MFTQMILSILRDKKPDYLAVTMDYSDETTERKTLYPEYKANRDASPEDLSPQISRIFQILEAMEIPTYQVKGQEADDIIATIASKLAGDDVRIVVVSADKDLHQILTKKVSLWDPGRDRVVDPESLETKNGYTPEQAVEIQTLTGDSTDNVPGVPGIGPKKAAALIQKYGSVEGVREHVEELTPKMKENVKAHADRFELTRQLVTLNRGVDIDFDLESCSAHAPDPSKVLPIFQELGFRRIIEQIERSTATDSSETTSSGDVAQSETSSRDSADYHSVDTPEKFASFIALLREQKSFAVDTETTSLRPVDALLVGLSFSWKPKEGWYLPLRSNNFATSSTSTARSRR